MSIGRSSFWPYLLLALAFAFSCADEAPAQKSLDLSPSRPTVANSPSIQAKGVLQVETGYDAYPQTPPGNQQAVDTALYYTPSDHLRLDFTWTAFSYTHDAEQQAAGVGTIQIGGKAALLKEQPHHWWPGLGFQYEAELPTASAETFNNLGQQAILLMNHHIGPVNLILNGSVVQSDCQTRLGCSYGGQQSAALSYHPVFIPHTTLYAEAFAQNVSQSNSPPGTYVFGGFLRRFGDAFGINGGVRFGVSDHSASIGTTVGLVFGKRLRKAE